jgi:hypothetical protein
LTLIAWRPDATRIAAVAVVLALALAGSHMFTHVSARVLPDGRKNAVYNNVAYIDASHLEASSDNDWEPDGTAELALTLMRNGYLTFRLPELASVSSGPGCWCRSRRPDPSRRPSGRPCERSSKTGASSSRRSAPSTPGRSSRFLRILASGCPALP